MVRGEGQFQSIARHLPSIEERAGIVDQNVDSRFRGRNFRGYPFHLLQERKIGVINAMIDARGGLAPSRQSRFATSGIARNPDDASSHCSHFIGGHGSNTRGRSGNYDNSSLHT